MRWGEIISEKFQKASPIRVSTTSKIEKAQPLIPAHPPIDPLASIIQQITPAIGQAAQTAVELDDQEEEQVIAQILSQKNQSTEESMKDKKTARDIIKKKYTGK